MVNNCNILIADDDQQILETLKLLLKYEFNKIKCLSNPNLIPEVIRKEKFDVVLLDMNFSTGKTSGNEGLYWLREIKKQDSDLTVVMISAYATINLAVEAMREGAIDFILKPWENQKLLATLKSACKYNYTKEELATSKAINKQITEDADKQFTLVHTESVRMQKIMDIIYTVAPTEANILILGENGTGKEVIAREIHKKSRQKDEAFVHVDLGAIVENLFESELFGHTKGSFTGAIANKKGRIEIANNSTLFLDEIGNISIPLQGKLLTAIQNKEVYPVGSQRKVKVNTRLICATNKNINKLIKENRFREDLLYRINTIEIEIPPLRERKEDIRILTEHFIERFNQKYSKNCKINEKTHKQLENHTWPGNVRELQHSLEKAVILTTKDYLQIESINPGGSYDLINEKDNHKTWEEIELYYLKKAISRYYGNISEIAKELKLSRPAIYRKIKKYGL
ncbi:MAG: sigma-54 dependent transcriptional regulator [Bacteroidales bacterium]|nr:sigma-54 dependent transcriptional regulator [Bacteroidales bacterium]